jgi:hypothetical protein
MTDAVQPSPRPAWPDRGAWTRSLTAAVAAGVLFSIAGAFGSGPLPFLIRTPFMVAISLIATSLGLLAFGLTGQVPWLARAWWRRGLAAGLLMTLPIGTVIWAALRLLFLPGLPASDILANLPTSAATSLFFCGWAAWRYRGRPAPGDPPAEAPRPAKFLERLPARLQGAELWAVQAEDHYLRLHTSKGQDLILMRLSDAVKELEGLDGAQAHRSWWVARAALAGVRRGDGRATLTLPDGAEVPVSRTHARRLREHGWF